MTNMPKIPTPLPGLLVLNAIVFGIAGYYFTTGLPPFLMALIGLAIGVLLTVLFYFLFVWLGKYVRRIPLATTGAVLAALVSLVVLKSSAFRWPDFLYYPVILLGIAFSLIITYGLKKLQTRRDAIWPYAGMALALIFLVAGILWLKHKGSDPFAADLTPPFADAALPTLSETGLRSPATTGGYPVQTFTYGSGEDKQRSEYREGVRFRTPTVDASGLLPDWKGKKKKWREKYWEFGVKNFPLNGRVHLPEGEGPFPLILMVHGNHSMIDYSDGGYAYLGDLLASRGFIAVSVDENFINGHWSGDFRGREMPTRAWLLLKHLEQWATWNQDRTHALAGKVDMDRIVLIGHSRGGEAVSIAAAFNQLPHFPDDAAVTFDFNFNIRGIVAIAPTDYRYHRQISLENINFLSLQGSYDADETSFWGMRAYRRLKFTDGNDWFKAGVYLHRANHGQFNSSWGSSDFGGPVSWLLNRGALIPGEDQRLAASVFISAFAEAALHDDPRYMPIFENVDVGRDWLPDNYYLTHFANSDCRTIVDFEDDLDLSTGGPVAFLAGNHLKIWRETGLKTRDNGSQENHAAVLAWDYGTVIPTDSIATYELTLRDTLFRNIDSDGSIRLVLAAGDPSELKLTSEEGEKRPEKVPDLRVILEDEAGHTAGLVLSQVKSIAPRLKSRFTKFSSLDQDMIGKEWEVQPETFHLPLRAFRTEEAGFDFTRVNRIRLLFDQSPYGIILVDDIGLQF